MAEPLALAGASWGMSIAGWVASPIISKLLNQGFSYLEMDVAARIETLEVTILPQFQEVIDLAEKHGYKSNMEKWLRRLKDAMYEAEDAIDFYKSRLLQQKLGEFCDEIGGTGEIGLESTNFLSESDRFSRFQIDLKEMSRFCPFFSWLVELYVAWIRIPLECRIFAQFAGLRTVHAWLTEGIRRVCRRIHSVSEQRGAVSARFNAYR